jgi:hypothetical protein
MIETKTDSVTNQNSFNSLNRSKTMKTKRIAAAITSFVFAVLTLLSAAAPRAEAAGPVNWSQVTNYKALDISVDTDGTVWFIALNGMVIRWSASKGLQNMNLNASRIAVGPKGNALVAQSNGTIFTYTGSSWRQMYNVLAKDVGVGANGAVWVVSTGGGVYRWSDAVGWQNMNFKANRIAVDPKGNAWVT